MLFVMLTSPCASTEERLMFGAIEADDCLANAGGGVGGGGGVGSGGGESYFTC